MVHKKRASKRVSLKTKYKIQRKVAEHNRKERRAAKKNPNKQRLKKDPGIPNLWPFKEKLLKEMEEKKEKMEADKVAQKEKRAKDRAKRRKLPSSMERLAKQANRETAEFDAKDPEAGQDGKGLTTWKSNSVRDSSMKAFYRDFKRVVDGSDVVLEVLDARDPLGCRCRHVEESILKKDPNKKIILVLNKIDLVPKEVTELWLKHLRNDFPTIAFKASTQSQRKNLSQVNVDATKASEHVLNSTECLGADTLVKLLKNYCRNADIKTSITVGLIGYPNVGKSSVINSLKRTKACNVGSTPGLTRNAQVINLDKNIKLLDCPGIIFASENVDSDIILRNCVNVQKLSDPIEPVGIILQRCNHEQVMQLYEIPKFEDTMQFLAHIAFKKGRLAKGGVPDYDKAARAVLQDWNSGLIPFYTMPPKKDESFVSATVVPGWSKEFNVDEVFAEEQSAVIEGLPSAAGQTYCAMEPGMAGEVAFESDDEEEDMEEAEDNSSVTLNLAAKKKSKSEKAGSRDVKLDSSLNPQQGQAVKKAEKERRKAKRREQAGEDGGEEEVDMAPADDAGTTDMYDFSTDFVASAVPIPASDDDEYEEYDDDDEEAVAMQ